jgi:hypothetical protein
LQGQFTSPQSFSFPHEVVDVADSQNSFLGMYKNKMPEWYVYFNTGLGRASGESIYPFSLVA